jgi:hypothetical protein
MILVTGKGFFTLSDISSSRISEGLWMITSRFWFVNMTPLAKPLIMVFSRFFSVLKSKSVRINSS